MKGKTKREYIEYLLHLNPDRVFTNEFVRAAIEMMYGELPTAQVTSENLRVLVEKGTVKKIGRGVYQAKLEGDDEA